MNDTIYLAVDTLVRAVPIDDTILILQPETELFSWNISFGDIIALIGMIGSVAVFCWELYHTRLENGKNLRSTWFLEVIIQPNMDMINKFYDKAIEDADTKIKLLSNKYNNGGVAKEINNELAKFQRELKDYVKTSLGHFQILLKASEPKIANEIDIVLDDLVDILTKYVDGYEDYDGSSIKLKALNNKQKFVSKLYSGWNKS